VEGAIDPLRTASSTCTGPHCVWATEPVTVLVDDLVEPELLPELLPELVLLSEPELWPDFVPEVPPEMVAVGVLVAPR